MYCSDECKKKAHEEYHSYECELSDVFYQEKLIHERFGFVMFFKALSACDNSMEKLQELVSDHLYGRKKSTVFDFNFTNMSEKEKTKALVLASLSAAKDPLTPMEVMMHRISFMALLENHSSLSHLTDSQHRFAANFIMSIHKAALVNGYLLSVSHSNPNDNECIFVLGSCFTPFLSLPSHWCVPNTTDTVVRNKHVWITIAPIKKGEQITVAYG